MSQYGTMYALAAAVSIINTQEVLPRTMSLGDADGVHQLQLFERTNDFQRHRATHDFRSRHIFFPRPNQSHAPGVSAHEPMVAGVV